MAKYISEVPLHLLLTHSAMQHRHTSLQTKSPVLYTQVSDEVVSKLVTVLKVVRREGGLAHFLSSHELSIEHVRRRHVTQRPESENRFIDTPTRRNRCSSQQYHGIWPHPCSEGKSALSLISLCRCCLRRKYQLVFQFREFCSKAILYSEDLPHQKKKKKKIYIMYSKQNIVFDLL